MIKTPDGTILESRHRWQMTCYKDKNGKMYGIDGGVDSGYRKFTGDMKDLAIYDDGTHETRRNNAFWTSYSDKKGINLEAPVTKFVKDLDSDHIYNILITQTHISDFMRRVLEDEIVMRCEYREETLFCMQVSQKSLKR